MSSIAFFVVNVSRVHQPVSFAASSNGSRGRSPSIHPIREPNQNIRLLVQRGYLTLPANFINRLNLLKYFKTNRGKNSSRSLPLLLFMLSPRLVGQREIISHFLLNRGD